MSPSSRRAWIEILASAASAVFAASVALLAEGVDRNWLAKLSRMKLLVALLAEGVDRNYPLCSLGCFLPVALLAEGVDRN